MRCCLTLASLASLAVLARPATAQTLELTKSGGAVPGTTSLTLRGGTPGAPFALVVAPRESSTTLPSGATLDVAMDWLRLLPALGFVGRLDAQGVATRSLALPNDARLIGQRFS